MNNVILPTFENNVCENFPHLHNILKVFHKKMKTGITLQSNIQRNTNMVTSNLDGEIVMMSVENGEYYGLDEIGTRIWQLIEHPIVIEKLITCLTNEFEVERQECEQDTLEFLEDLFSRNLINLVGEKD